jgi:hypothetical protein
MIVQLCLPHKSIRKPKVLARGREPRALSRYSSGDHPFLFRPERSMNPSYEALLTEFAANVGLDAAELLSTQEIVLDEHTIGLQPDGDTADSDLVFFTVLGTPDAAQLARISRTLLEANSFWVGTGGCTLGVQRDTGAVTLCGRIAVASIDGGTLAALLDGFADTATFWRSFVNGTPDGSDAMPPAGMAFHMRA